MTVETRFALYAVACTVAGLMCLASAVALQWHDRHLEVTP